MRFSGRLSDPGSAPPAFLASSIAQAASSGSSSRRSRHISSAGAQRGFGAAHQFGSVRQPHICVCVSVSAFGGAPRVRRYWFSSWCMAVEMCNYVLRLCQRISLTRALLYPLIYPASRVFTHPINGRPLRGALLSTHACRGCGRSCAALVRWLCSTCGARLRSESTLLTRD